MNPRKAFSLAFLVGCGLMPPLTLGASPEIAIDPLLTRILARDPNAEVQMFTVTFAPGAADPIHRHDAQAFLYVLEGEIVMQVKGSAPVRLKPGQTFYESPTDVHVVGRNASESSPARFLVVLIKQRGAPLLTVVPER